ncbi:MAG TPA: hypothetical protein VGM21_03385 [Actinomycetota bacterium]
MPGFEVVRRWKGRIAIARDGEPLGAIAEVLYDAAGDQPGWALLDAAAGWRLVPVMHAVEDGTVVRVDVPARLVGEAPTMEPGERLWPQEEAALYAHYGLAWPGEVWEEEDADLAAVEYLPSPARSLPPAP